MELDISKKIRGGKFDGLKLFFRFQMMIFYQVPSDFFERFVLILIFSKITLIIQKYYFKMAKSLIYIQFSTFFMKLLYIVPYI